VLLWSLRCTLRHAFHITPRIQRTIPNLLQLLRQRLIWFLVISIIKFITIPSSLMTLRFWLLFFSIICYRGVEDLPPLSHYVTSLPQNFHYSWDWGYIWFQVICSNKFIANISTMMTWSISIICYTGVKVLLPLSHYVTSLSHFH